MASPTVAELQQTIKKLQEELSAEKQKVEEMKGTTKRTPIAQMSAEVVDSNPYSRLMALKRMGIVDNYEVSL
ncbi:ubiquitin modifier-activating enzyme 5 [Plakobranchus ocellatus]|uniref:Ubiquitin modifier-activating enzyme 5 n=1 Tax=Plakobranchus ocellatus TaxID=259542 RepID=A0AAV4AEC4_9GAST|nr:ubiquitin modifier-activating enzyme 5 [Plakobranchus ocellatus]